ncbi:hypothetical protein PRZ48_005430 [Zasmidium cellare]|uniref:Major facilitator superfamily (MFS) profile domain-containing protein n=1 Tax=Zasmidium cellare TaxID=395010 RepID=A0ABR0ESC0_ZASCE|nr:hypothetical protein PRZ48_005430 [Zasmidium cellare]
MASTDSEKVDKEDLQEDSCDINADLEQGLPTNDAEYGEPDTPAADKEKKTSDDETFQVQFAPNDPSNPHNFNKYFKAWLCLQMSILALCGSLGSSIISPAQGVLAKKFNVSDEVMVLATSLYVLGFALGPVVWAPISELHGRKLSMLPAVFIQGLFSIGTANSQNAAALFITRFFGGVFGSAPVSNVSAALGDFYEPNERGTAIAVYSICVIGGPTIGPVIGAALTVNRNLGWRWTVYIEAIFSFFMVALTTVCLPETYAPVILARKARKLRKAEGDSRYWQPHERDKITARTLITKHLSRPIRYVKPLAKQRFKSALIIPRMLLTEPMVTCITFYASFCYGILYLNLQVFPIVFEQHRHWPLVTSTLPFLGLLVGVLCATFINLGNQPIYAKAVKANGGKAVPEARLPPMLIGGVLFVIGLFWFGWTAEPGVQWIVPVIASAFIGAGFNVVFQQCLNYLVDSYGLYAASAVSANTFLRSLLASGLPMAAMPMFNRMGVGPAMSVLGAVAAVLLPAPVLFMRYGAWLRAKSRFAS